LELVIRYEKDCYFKHILTAHKILSVSCDNASANNVMIDHLAILNDDFPGSSNRTRCFAHIINLVVKSILKQFDVPKKQVNRVLDTAERELMVLAEDLEEEEEENLATEEIEGDEDESHKMEDNVDGLVDEAEQLEEEEHVELCKAVLPARMMLTKVRYNYFVICVT
jgi:hypothetical protein